jgi:hypothetical protein
MLYQAAFEDSASKPLVRRPVTARQAAPNESKTGRDMGHL